MARRERHDLLLRRGGALPRILDQTLNLRLRPRALDERTLDAAQIRRELLSADVEASLLEIEIPEGALMRDVATSTRVLNGLEALGVAISVDDFGTGYSSFAYLAKFPVDTLKIDRSFVNEMRSNTSSRKIVRGLIQLAHSLSMKVVAEGVETEEQTGQLQDMNCDQIQGFGYGRPMFFEQFCEFVKTHRKPGLPDAFSI